MVCITLFRKLVSRTKFYKRLIVALRELALFSFETDVFHNQHSKLADLLISSCTMMNNFDPDITINSAKFFCNILENLRRTLPEENTKKIGISIRDTFLPICNTITDKRGEATPTRFVLCKMHVRLVKLGFGLNSENIEAISGIIRNKLAFMTPNMNFEYDDW